MWDVDFMHPIDPGMAAISDMVAYLLQQTALSLLLNPLSRTDRTLLQERLPDPMFKGVCRVQGCPRVRLGCRSCLALLLTHFCSRACLQAASTYTAGAVALCLHAACIFAVRSVHMCRQLGGAQPDVLAASMPTVPAVAVALCLHASLLPPPVQAPHVHMPCVGTQGRKQA
jgi:hypothetical protein